MTYAIRIYLVLHVIAILWVLNLALSSYNSTDGFYVINYALDGFSDPGKWLHSAIAAVLLLYFVIAPFLAAAVLEKLRRWRLDQSRVF